MVDCPYFPRFLPHLVEVEAQLLTFPVEMVALDPA